MENITSLNIVLKRVSSTKEATFGVLLHDFIPFAVTIERPWLDNHPDVSCIPAGTYRCGYTISPHFGRVYEVKDVPDRGHILIHKGNTAMDTKGCIIVAEHFGLLSSVPAGLDSAKGYEDFIAVIGDADEFVLRIIEFKD